MGISAHLIARRSAWSFLLLLAFLGCGAEGPDAPSVTPPTSPPRDQLNVAYGPSSEQLLDVHLPTDQGQPSPIVVLVHGGGWHWGARSDMEAAAQTLRARGYAAFNVDYRLGSWPSYIQLEPKLDDIDLAIQFALSRPTEWRLSRKVALLGYSAGGHLSLQDAYARYPDACAVVSFSGPTDLTDPLYQGDLRDSLTWLLGVPLTSDPASIRRYQDASPLYHVRAGLPATLLVHGTADPIASYPDTQRLDAALRNVGSTSQLMPIEGGDHGAIWTDWNAVMDVTSAWLTAHCSGN